VSAFSSTGIDVRWESRRPQRRLTGV
jgi:hypothetical protein